MRVIGNHSSPNFSEELIPVEFIVLHYTAGDLARTMEIFADRQRGVCAHFVLDTDGAIYDLGGFWDGPIRRGAHAGESVLRLSGEEFRSFNAMSIGVEIVNLNGNLFPYTEAQYTGLHGLLTHMLGRFPSLRSPGRIIGHEHIAGFRGKCDPGLCFDWGRVLGALGLTTLPVHQATVCNENDVEYLRDLLAREPEAERDELFWSRLSGGLEERIKARGGNK